MSCIHADSETLRLRRARARAQAPDTHIVAYLLLVLADGETHLGCKMIGVVVGG